MMKFNYPDSYIGVRYSVFDILRFEFELLAGFGKKHRLRFQR
jgi:hypothetical protein